uniref:Tc1-like transposase DDE domain-containing protein n=1 Tax=Mycena chlorophos TaxID=658473 RepID=A0ABQ0L3F9_MYCCL|nr:predicted protein [Mycena chlorophos]
MPYRVISRDVKMAAIRLFERGCLDLQTILDCVGFSESTFYRILKLWRATGDVVTGKQRSGRRRILQHEDIVYLLELVRLNPVFFLEQLGSSLRDNQLVEVHYTTIHRELIRAGISVKQVESVAQERNADLRNDYIREISQYTPEQLGFIDETSKNDKTPNRKRGRGPVGQRVVVDQQWVRGVRLTATGLLTIDGMLTSTVVEGSMHRDQFVAFLEGHVLPLCSPFPGPLSVLVMDNAKIHHGEDVYEVCAQAGVRVVYLPPYSPDFNPIELAFSQIKSFIHKNHDLFRYGPHDPPFARLYDMQEAMRVVTECDALGYFIHCGYF